MMVWRMLTGKPKNRARALRHQRQTRHCATIILVLVVLFSINHVIKEQSNKPIGCGVVQIWSHRGHLDSYSSESATWTCDHVLASLHENGITHIDVDVIYHDGVALVAHPAEMQEQLGSFSPSPCSKLPLGDFIVLLNKHYGNDGYLLTMEPKSAWKDAGDFLAAPQDVIASILDAIDEHPISKDRCGIILDTWQADDPRVNRLLKRIEEHCQLVTPLRRSDAPLEADDVPPAKFSIIMPTIELFGGEDGKWWLKQAQQNKAKVVVWVVDSLAVLQKALQLKGVHGVISNHPVVLKKMYDEVCSTSLSRLRDMDKRDTGMFSIW